MMTKYHDVPCPKCRVIFGVPANWDDTFRKTGQDFYCLVGHTMSYTLGESEESKLRRERNSLKQENARLADEARLSANRASAAKREVAHLKTCAANSACPCCGKTVLNANLKRHLATKHAEFVAEGVST